MKNTLFLILCFLPGIAAPSWADIEIFANGHKYDSLQEYVASKNAIAAPSLSSPANLNTQQKDDIAKGAQRLGINVDFNKVKTFQINKPGLSGKTMHQFYVLSVENGVVGALQDFYQSWGQTNLQLNSIISSEELQLAIQQAVATSKDPKFLISEPGKVRIMALTAQDDTR